MECRSASVLVGVVSMVLVFTVPVFGVGPDVVVPPGPNHDADSKALKTAVALLPRAPVRIAVVDVMENEGPIRKYLLTLDAFVVNGNEVIYVVQQSDLLQGARQGSAIHSAMLATALWHEMAHLSGADEPRARRAEEEMWTRFVRDGIVDAISGLRYLRALSRRPDDRLRASR